MMMETACMHSARAVPRSHWRMVLGLTAVLCAGSACDVGGRGNGLEDAESGIMEGADTARAAGSVPDSAGQAAAAPIDTGKSAPAEMGGGEDAAPDGTGLAEQAVRFLAGSTGRRVVVWADSTPSARIQIQESRGGESGAAATCQVDAPRDVIVEPRAFPRGAAATLEVRAEVGFTSGDLAVRCAPDPPMRIALVNAALMLARDSGSLLPPGDDPDGFGLADLLAALALLAAFGILVVLWRLSTEIKSHAKSLTHAIQGRPSTKPEVQVLPATGPDLAPMLGRIEESLRGEAGEREKIVAGLRTLSQTVAQAGTALSAALEGLPCIQAPPSSGDAETAGAAPWPAEAAVAPNNRLASVFESLHRSQGLVGEDGALKREAGRLKGLTDTVGRAAELIASRLENSATDARSSKLGAEVSRLRARCEQLAGRFSELQMDAGLTAFPVRAYIYPNHRNVRDVANQVMAGLEESALLLAGQTDLLQKQFEQMVTEVLRPTLKAANYLRADEPEPEWLSMICKALGAELFRPQVGEGIDGDGCEVLSGSPGSLISGVRAPAYMYNHQVLIPALVEMNGDG
ncbi:MAG TPA: hypothetical protein VLK84_02585 [Longimicrobium sp.]|nr:hypothetical protein [Longimicrobium sp.]